MDLDFATVGIFTGIAAAFVVANLLLSKLLRPASGTDAAKRAIYECGEPTIGQAWIRFDIRFYTVALMFVVFDVEVALLFPWAAIYRDFVDQGLGALVFLEAAAFIVILMVGLAYVWARGDIEWTAASQTTVSQTGDSQTGDSQTGVSAGTPPGPTPVAPQHDREPALVGGGHGP